MKRVQMRQLDARTAAVSIVGMCLRIAWWVEHAPVEPLGALLAGQAVNTVLAFDGERELGDAAALLRTAAQPGAPLAGGHLKAGHGRVQSRRGDRQPILTL